MKPGLKKALKISGIVLGAVVVLAVAAVLLLVFDKPLVRNIVLKQLNKTAGTTARLGRIDYSVFPFRVTVDSLDLGQEDAFQKLGVSLPRFEARGSLWRLIRGAKPAFDSLTADGLELRLEQKAVSETPLNIEQILLQVSDAFAWTKRVALKNARLSLAFLNGRAEVENLDLVLTPGPDKDILGFEIGRAGLSLEDKAGSTLLAAGLRSSGRIGLVSPISLDGTFTLSQARFAVGGAEGSLESASLGVAGRFDRSAQELTVSRLALTAPGLLSLEGKAAGRLGHGFFIEAETAAKLDLSAAAALLRTLLPADYRDAVKRGRAEINGKYLLQRTDQGSKDNLAATLTLDGVELVLPFSGRPLPVRASGRVDASGPTSAPRFSADIRSSLGRLAASGLTVASADLHLQGAGSMTDANITRLDARLAGLAYDAAEGRRIAFDSVALAASGRLDLAHKQGVLTSLEARLPGLAPLRLSGRYGMSPGASAELALETRGLDLPALRAVAGPFVPAAYASWDLGGALDLVLSARRPAGRRSDWRFGATISLSGAKFNDPSFTVAGDNLNPVLKLEGAGSPAKGFSFSGGLDISQGESLWKAVYVTWSKYPLKLTASGRLDPASGGIEGLAARVALPQVGTMDVKGSVRFSPALALDLTTEASLSLGPLYSLYSQAGVAEAARTKLEGSLGASLAVRKTADGLAVGGRVKLSGANIELPGSKTLLVGLTADLPLSYDSRAAAATAEAPAAALPEEGHFHIGELQSPFLTLKPIDISLRAGVNALALEPLSLPLFGGSLELGRTTLRLDPATGALRGTGSLALRDLDISKLPVQSPQFKLTGMVQADFPRLDIATDKIAISGRGEASVFGGQVVLRDLSVADPFAEGRSISLDIDLLDLDMKKLTDEVPFGEVTGIVRGQVRGLVITYGQPERFDFRLESVPRKGVAQTFSLKAVDNLTVLSSGQKASGGTSAFWMKFIRGFRYEKLGIVSTLRNDTFTLNGTIHEKGVEYLVKKPALFGISVVNRDPSRSISFKEMVSRLKRIGPTGG